MPNDEFYLPEDWDTFDPQAEADAAVTLIDRMKQEEDSLFDVGPGLAYQPQPAPVSSPYDPRDAYNLAVRRFDDRAALAAMQQIYPGERIIGVNTSPPGSYGEAMPSAAQVQFEAQQRYVRDIERGVPQSSALANWGPLMMQAAAGRQTGLKPAPRWVPPDPTTGAPGHFETGTGTVHIPAQQRATPEQAVQTATQRSELTLKNQRLRYLYEELSKSSRELELARASKSEMRITRAQSDVDELRRQIRSLEMGAAVAPVEAPRTYGETKTAGQWKIRKVVK